MSSRGLNYISSKENLLSNDPVPVYKRVHRNYDFSDSKRLPFHRMIDVNNIRIPSIPGTCYHAILCSLAQYKDEFCSWGKIMVLVEKNMKMYGGQKAWKHFIGKTNIRSYERRIRENVHTLTRTGKNCYGFRLHEQGMCIYYFRDGAMLVTGGKFKKFLTDSYNVYFPDGRKLQHRYRGTNMSWKEYKIFLEKGYIEPDGRILDIDAIHRARATGSIDDGNGIVHVSVLVDDDYDQSTADRLERIGLVVEEASDNELIGTILRKKLLALENDSQVKKVYGY